jgi:ABC-type Fe3+-citrate transport system substrate-binding protein
MAMLDGITQKIAPVTHLSDGREASDSFLQTSALLAEVLDKDSEFLMQADVFSEPLIQALCQRLSITNNN